ncbi:MAG: hypothetical protein AMXMBFR7_16290 [Planctomycetota bacterium]
MNDDELRKVFLPLVHRARQADRHFDVLFLWIKRLDTTWLAIRFAELSAEAQGALVEGARYGLLDLLISFDLTEKGLSRAGLAQVRGDVFSPPGGLPQLLASHLASSGLVPEGSTLHSALPIRVRLSSRGRDAEQTCPDVVSMRTDYCAEPERARIAVVELNKSAPEPALHAQTVNIQHVGQVRAETVNLPAPPAQAQTSAEPLADLEAWIFDQLKGAYRTAKELYGAAKGDAGLIKKSVGREKRTIEGALSNLKKSKRIALKRGSGYYRPDAPPNAR